MSNELTISNSIVPSEHIKSQFFIYRSFVSQTFVPYNQHVQRSSYTECLFDYRIPVRYYRITKYIYYFNEQKRKLDEINEEAYWNKLKNLMNNNLYVDDLKNQIKIQIKMKIQRRNDLIKILENAIKINGVEQFEGILNTLKIKKFKDLNIQEILQKIRNLNIPQKYKPTEKILKFYKFYERDYSYKKNNYYITIIIFDVALISLLEQKYPNDEYIQNVVRFFKSLASYDKGVDFDVYIGNWAKRLWTENSITNYINLLK